MQSFKEFFYDENPISDIQIAQMYFHGQMAVREIAKTSQKSIREVYRIVRQYGQPNRTRQDQHNVISLSDSGMGYKSIAELTGYTSRQVRNIVGKNRFS